MRCGLDLHPNRSEINDLVLYGAGKFGKSVAMLYSLDLTGVEEVRAEAAS